MTRLNDVDDFLVFNDLYRNEINHSSITVQHNLQWLITSCMAGGTICLSSIEWRKKYTLTVASNHRLQLLNPRWKAHLRRKEHFVGPQLNPYFKRSHFVNVVALCTFIKDPCAKKVVGVWKSWYCDKLGNLQNTKTQRSPFIGSPGNVEEMSHANQLLPIYLLPSYHNENNKKIHTFLNKSTCETKHIPTQTYKQNSLSLFH